MKLTILVSLLALQGCASLAACHADPDCSRQLRAASDSIHATAAQNYMPAKPGVDCVKYPRLCN